MRPQSKSAPSAPWQIAFSLLALPLFALGIAAVVMGWTILDDPRSAIRYRSTGVLEFAHALVLVRVPEPHRICGGLAIALGISFVALAGLTWFRWNPRTLDQIIGAHCFIPSLLLVMTVLYRISDEFFLWRLALIPLAIALLLISRCISRHLQARAFPAG